MRSTGSQHSGSKTHHSHSRAIRTPSPRFCCDRFDLQNRVSIRSQTHGMISANAPRPSVVLLASLLSKSSLISATKPMSSSSFIIQGSSKDHSSFITPIPITSPSSFIIPHPVVSSSEMPTLSNGMVRFGPLGEPAASRRDAVPLSKQVTLEGQR